MKRIIFLFVFFLSWSCHVNNIQPSSNHLFSIMGNCKFSKLQGIDSEIGLVKCGNTELKYEFGRYSSTGPISDTEKFKMAFRGKYYVDFFEKIYIDSKLYKLYMDSVQIIRIDTLKVHNKSLLFDCSSCNRLAILKFRKSWFKFPFYSNQALSDDTLWSFHVDTIENYKRKIFLSHTNGTSGIYLEPLNDSKLFNKLSLQTENINDHSYLMTLFKSVRIK